MKKDYKIGDSFWVVFTSVAYPAQLDKIIECKVIKVGRKWIYLEKDKQYFYRDELKFEKGKTTTAGSDYHTGYRLFPSKLEAIDWVTLEATRSELKTKLANFNYTYGYGTLNNMSHRDMQIMISIINKYSNDKN